ncbi:MAG: hypothetical protein U9N11_08560 [Campylobacterota bacterium]|nr:hypothetical protein [Campylobacterota bacterium]
MDKSYFEMLDPLGLGLALIYIFILSQVLLVVAKRLDVDISYRTIVSIFSYFFLIFLIGTFTDSVANLPDTRLFSTLIIENEIPARTSLGVKLFYYISYPIRVLSFFKLEVFIVFQIAILILSLMILWKSWQIVLIYNGQNKQLGINIFVWLSLVYPAFLLYIPVPLREFAILLGMSILTYGLVAKYYHEKSMLFIILGSIIVMFVRPQLVVIVILFFAIFQKDKRVKILLIVSSLFLIPIVFTSFMHISFTPEYFTQLRARYQDVLGVHAYGAFEWHSYVDMVMDAPLLFLQFIFSPFPVLHRLNPLDFFAILLDVLFTIVIYLSVIYAGIRVSKVYVFIFLLSSFMFSMWEFYIFGAVRHRMPLVAILLPVASYGILKFYQDVKRRV